MAQRVRVPEEVQQLAGVLARMQPERRLPQPQLVQLPLRRPLEEQRPRAEAREDLLGSLRSGLAQHPIAAAARQVIVAGGIAEDSPERTASSVRQEQGLAPLPIATAASLLRRPIAVAEPLAVAECLAPLPIA